MIKKAHEQDKRYWGPLNWVPLYWTLSSYYNYKRHGFPCAYRSKYLESSEIIYCQVVFRSQHYILSRENRLFEANWMNKTKQSTWATQLWRAKQMLKLTTTQTRKWYSRQYKNISELTLTAFIIILPVDCQCLSTEINILKPWISFHWLVSYHLTAYTECNYDHWLFVHLWQFPDKSTACLICCSQKAEEPKIVRVI